MLVLREFLMCQLPAHAKAELIEQRDKRFARFATDHQPVWTGTAKKEGAKAPLVAIA